MSQTPEEIIGGWNERYLGGGLTEAKRALFADIFDFPPAVAEFVEAALRRTGEMGIGAEDVSDLYAWELGFIMPRILPSAWGGAVPPITLQGRHLRIDEYFASNRWHSLSAGGRLLDIGCGFPPLTSVDTAKRFPDSTVIGADAAFGRWMVYDERGDYACFRADGELRYFQPSGTDYGRWDELHADPDATRRHFAAILESMKPDLAGAEGYAVAEKGGMRVVQDPIEEYARDNLSFLEAPIGEADPGGEVDVVRCMNVLIYFDNGFRERALSWIATLLKEGGIFLCGLNWSGCTYARYSVYRKENGALVPKEFAFGLENVRPLEMVPVFAFHDEEIELSHLMRCVRSLRGDDGFLRLLNERLDEAQEELGFCPRGDDGAIGGVDAEDSPAVFEEKRLEFSARANAPELAAAAHVVLAAAGHEVWLNEVGDTAIRPPS